MLSVKENQLLLQIFWQNSIWKFRLRKLEIKRQRKNQRLTELNKMCFYGTCQGWEVSYSTKWIYSMSKRLLKSNILFRIDSFWKARRLEAILGRVRESLIIQYKKNITFLWQVLIQNWSFKIENWERSWSHQTSKNRPFRLHVSRCKCKWRCQSNGTFFHATFGF